jgi:hypothetical protein
VWFIVREAFPREDRNRAGRSPSDAGRVGQGFRPRSLTAIRTEEFD